MKNVIKKNSKLIIAFSLGFILSIGTVFAASKLYASKVSVDTTSMPALGSESNVEEALTYLYQRAADSGLTGTGNHALVPTRYRNIYETYLDPTNLSKKCTAAEVVSTTGTKTGCMKWYVYNISDTSYSMILDHNTDEDLVQWTEAVTHLETLRKTWDSRLGIRTISYGELLEAAGSTSRLNAQSSSGSIIYTPGYNGTYNSTYGPNALLKISYGTPAETSTGSNPLGWLIDNLSECEKYGCNTSGTSTNIGYFIHGTRYIVENNTNINELTSSSLKAGLRPVIDISKAIF